MGRILGGLLLTVCMAMPASAQVRTAKGKPAPPPPAAPRAAYNSTAKDTTPFNCDQYRRHPHPMMMGYCNSIENMTLSLYPLTHEV